ncbi:MAG: type II toxin-antitoxin system HicB family antitoxin [Bryobacteraceae bacterium]
MIVSIELDREEDGRWIAEALEIPGVICYGITREEAISNTERLAIEVIADRIAHGEIPASPLNMSFVLLDEQMARRKGETSISRFARHRLGCKEAIRIAPPSG